MYEETFDVSESPRITIEDCIGNLSVKRSDVNQVTVHMDDDANGLVFDQDGNVIVFTAKDDCDISCPANSTLNIINTQKNLKVKKIKGDITIGTVEGNIDLRGVGAVKLETGLGNLRVKTSTGAVEVNNVSGSARLQKITGSTKLGRVGGSLRTEALMLGLIAEAVGGGARLEPPFTQGETYQLTVGGSLEILLPDEPNLGFEIIAGGQVQTNVPNLVLSKDGANITGTLGDGEAIITAVVGGGVVVRSSSESDSEFGDNVNVNFDFDFDPESLAFLEDLGPQIEATVTKAMAHMETHLAEGLKYFDSDEFKVKMEKVAEKAQRAAEKAQRTVEKVERKVEGIAERAKAQAERAAEMAQMRVDQVERRGLLDRAQDITPIPQPTPVEKKNSEQLSILQQIKDGKITADEAADLLTAIG